jgi:hypothetical protein
MQVPAVLGTFRCSPPLLARPYTLIEKNDQVVHLICGICGPCKISDIMVNETAITDFPSGVIEVETREGWPDDEHLTMITDSVFEENVGQELSTHRLEADHSTLVEPYTGSYPRPYIMKTAERTDEFRIILSMPAGWGKYDSNSKALLALRLRIRPVGGAWVNLPEVHFRAYSQNPIRQEIWLVWGSAADEQALRASVATETSYFSHFYQSNSEWTADSYFSNGGSASPNVNVGHVVAGQDELYFFLNEETFSDTAYGGGLFTYASTSSGRYTIPDQGEFLNTVIVQSYASFRHEYPILETGLALIAMRARNIQVQSVSAVFQSYVDGETTENPRKLFEWVATGPLNARPLPVSQLENMDDWEAHCDDVGLTCNRLVEHGSVEDALNAIAICGDAVVRRSDKWGVVVDKDRSEEPMVALVTPQQMTSPLVVSKEFLSGSRGLVPSFHSPAKNYAITELSRPIFDDGVATDENTLVESVPYDGLTSEALVRRRAKRDLRTARLRSIKYSFELNLRHLDFRKGDKIGLAHDILINHYATGRIKSFVVEDGNLVSVTLNTMIEDVPVINEDNLFSVDDVLLLKNVFDISAGVTIGVQIELKDGSVASFPVSGVSGAPLSIDGEVAAPDGLKGGLVAAVGPLERESRPVIVGQIIPKNDFFAQIECVDLAPEIYQGL